MTSRKILIGVIGGLMVAAAGLVLVSAADLADEGTAQDGKALIAAAKSAYDESLELLSTGDSASVEGCYQWSRRIMDAEVRADRGNLRAPYDAAVAHHRRMLELHRLCAKLADAGSGAHAKTATAYYVLEAKAIAQDRDRG